MNLNVGRIGLKYRNILVVVKQTPFEFYSQLKQQGKAPVALRWERLRNRYIKHSQCVQEVIALLERTGVAFEKCGREELHRGQIEGKDLIIAVGGDGTILNTSSFLDSEIPVLGVNSDPTSINEKKDLKKVDERRSRGALAGTSLRTVQEDLPRILTGDVEYRERARIRCLSYPCTTLSSFVSTTAIVAKNKKQKQVSCTKRIHRDADAPCPQRHPGHKSKPCRCVPLPARQVQGKCNTILQPYIQPRGDVQSQRQ